MPPIIIIGMHRAGTSLLTELLQKMGVFIGNDLDDNFESQFFCNLNIWAFKQTGAEWDNPYNMRFIDNEIADGLSENFDRHLHSRHMKKNYGKAFAKLKNTDSFWAWKDPRNTFTLNLWQRIFPAAKILHIYRNPIDVAESLRKREQYFRDLRDSKTRTGLRKKYHEYFLTSKRLYSQSVRAYYLDEGIKLWEEYTGQALKYQENALHIAYEKLLTEPQMELEKICSFAGIKSDEETILQAVSDINPDRKFAFMTSKNLIEKYKEIQDSEILKALGYHNIIH
jgi:hypothetical protein